jgi:hypothetical protein
MDFDASISAFAVEQMADKSVPHVKNTLPARRGAPIDVYFHGFSALGKQDALAYGESTMLGEVQMVGGKEY